MPPSSLFPSIELSRGFVTVPVSTTSSIILVADFQLTSSYVLRLKAASYLDVVNLIVVRDMHPMLSSLVCMYCKLRVLYANCALNVPRAWTQGSNTQQKHTTRKIDFSNFGCTVYAVRTTANKIASIVLSW